MIHFNLYFNKDKVYACNNRENFTKFKLRYFLKYLTKTCVAHRLQYKIQGVISWTIINILKIPLVEYFYLIISSK